MLNTNELRRIEQKIDQLDQTVRSRAFWIIVLLLMILASTSNIVDKMTKLH